MLGQSWDDDYEVTPKLWEGTPMKTFPHAPWCWKFTYIYPKNDPNVGKYSSTMEHLGFGSVLEHVPPFIPFRNNLMYLLLMMFYEEDPANMAPNVQ